MITKIRYFIILSAYFFLSYNNLYSLNKDDVQDTIFLQNSKYVFQKIIGDSIQFQKATDSNDIIFLKYYLELFLNNYTNLSVTKTYIGNVKTSENANLNSAIIFHNCCINNLDLNKTRFNNKVVFDDCYIDKVLIHYSEFYQTFNIINKRKTNQIENLDSYIMFQNCYINYVDLNETLFNNKLVINDCYINEVLIQHSDFFQEFNITNSEINDFFIIYGRFYEKINFSSDLSSKKDLVKSLTIQSSELHNFHLQNKMFDLCLISECNVLDNSIIDGRKSYFRSEGFSDCFFSFVNSYSHNNIWFSNLNLNRCNFNNSIFEGSIIFDNDYNNIDFVSKNILKLERDSLMKLLLSRKGVMNYSYKYASDTVTNNLSDCYFVDGSNIIQPLNINITNFKIQLSNWLRFKIFFCSSDELFKLIEKINSGENIPLLKDFANNSIEYRDSINLVKKDRIIIKFDEYQNYINSQETFSEEIRTDVKSWIELQKLDYQLKFYTNESGILNIMYAIGLFLYKKIYNFGFKGEFKFFFSVIMVTLIFSLLYIKFFIKEINILLNSKEHIGDEKLVPPNRKFEYKKFIRNFLRSYWFSFLLFISPKYKSEYLNLSFGLLMLITLEWCIGILMIILFLIFLASKYAFIKLLFGV